MLPAEKKASVLAGTWNSIQGSKPGLGQPNDGALPGWYETDLYAGASIELDKRWTVSGTYYRYVSPSACVIEREAKRGEAMLMTRTRDFKTVLVPGDASMLGTYLTVELTGTTGSTFTGAIVRERQPLPMAG